MTWSYTGNPADSDKDYVRFLIGDTISADELLQDEEIIAVLGVESNVTLAAAIAAESIAAKFSREADTTMGKTRLAHQQKAEAYLELAKRLRKQSKITAAFNAIPYAGGISQGDKELVEQNTDRVEPIFEKDQFKNPLAVDPKRCDEQ